MHHTQKKRLAASFVVTLTSLPACDAPKKTSVASNPPVAVEPAHITASDGRCFLEVPTHCPTGHCNPPPPPEVDCPANMRDAAAPAPPARRPRGKEDWLRVKPSVAIDSDTARCSYGAETFCAPPGKSPECTSSAPVTVKCAPEADGGAYGLFHIAAFVWKDAVGGCHEVDAFTCGPGACDLPEGRTAQCKP